MGLTQVPCHEFSRAGRQPRDNEREKAIASCLFTFVYFRSRARRRFFLLFSLIVIKSGADKSLQSTLINLITLVDIDGTSHVAFEAGVEEA